jgi:hypothetical protein
MNAWEVWDEGRRTTPGENDAQTGDFRGDVPADGAMDLVQLHGRLKFLPELRHSSEQRFKRA